MELRNDVTINKMLKRQELDNEAFNNMETIIDDNVEVYNIEINKIVTCTIPDYVGETILLKRFINTKLYKMEFSKGVTMLDLLDYFELEDDIFITMCSRYYV